MTNKYLTFKIFAILTFFIMIIFVMNFKPIIKEAQGDATHYINLAKQIWDIEGAIDCDESHRSPFYSILLGPIMFVSGTQYAYIVMIFQFFLVYCSTLIIFRLSFNISKNSCIAWVAGLLTIFNLSIIFFAYNLLSETLAMFLFVLFAYFLIKHSNTGQINYIIYSGILTGLLILTRFNLLGLPVVVLCLLCFNFIFYEKKIASLLTNVVAFVLPVLLIISMWSLYNFVNNDFFGLLPSHHIGQRWAIPASINANNTVTEEYKEILNIFIKERKKMEEQINVNTYSKGSLLKYNIIKTIYYQMIPEINGFKLYLNAEPKLLKYYSLTNSSGKSNKLGVLLLPFYAQIKAQNRLILFKYQLFSLLNSFKYISPVLPLPIDKPLNLNILPSFIIKLYKISMLLIIFSVYILSISHILYAIKYKKFENIKNKIPLYTLIWYFPAIHFYANVLQDANRFKFPAEPIITSIFIIYIYEFFFKKKHSKQSCNL